MSGAKGCSCEQILGGKGSDSKAVWCKASGVRAALVYQVFVGVNGFCCGKLVQKFLGVKCFRRRSLLRSAK